MHAFIRALMITGALALTSGSALAQSWPSRQVFFIVPFAAGGGTDAFARPLAAQLDKQLNQRFLIENRAGAGGTAGAAAAAKATPDGYTFFIGAAHHTIAPSIYPRLTYDIQKDFIPVAVLAQPPHVVVVNPKRVAAKTLKELIDAAKASDGKMTYASAGNGTTHHLAGELFKIITGAKVAHVPYRGAGPAMQDLVAGHVDMIFDGLGTSAAMLSGGQIRGLAVTAPKRTPAFPDLPTVAEAGLPGFEFATWYAMWGIKGTPDDIIKRMAAEVGKALQDPAIKAMWARNGTETPSVAGEAMAKLIASDIEKWGKVVKTANVKLEGN